MSREPRSSRNQSSQTKIVWIVLVVVFVIGLLVLLGLELFGGDGSSIAIGQKPADFTLQTYSGDIIDTASLRGKIVLINFWSSWCTTCDEEAILLEEAYSSLQTGNIDVVFLGVAYMDTEPDSLDFLAAYGVTYPNGPDLRGEISNIYQVSSVPETYVLDAEGVLRAVKIGPFATIGQIINAIENSTSGVDAEG